MKKRLRGIYAHQAMLAYSEGYRAAREGQPMKPDADAEWARGWEQGARDFPNHKRRV